MGCGGDAHPAGAGASDEAAELRDDVSFFQALKAQLVKTSATGKSEGDLDAAVRQLVSKAIVPEGGLSMCSRRPG